MDTPTKPFKISFDTQFKNIYIYNGDNLIIHLDNEIYLHDKNIYVNATLDTLSSLNIQPQIFNLDSNEYIDISTFLTLFFEERTNEYFNL